jgi:chemotaxis signal transduction protein
VICVVDLQKSMDVLYGEPGSSNNLCLTSKFDGNVEIGIEVERLTDISELVDQQTTTIPALQMEPNVRCVPVVSVMHIS